MIDVASLVPGDIVVLSKNTYNLLRSRVILFDSYDHVNMLFEGGMGVDDESPYTIISVLQHPQNKTIVQVLSSMGTLAWACAEGTYSFATKLRGGTKIT